MSTKYSLQEISDATIHSLNSGDGLRALELACIGMQNPKAGHVQRLLFVNAFQGGMSSAFVPVVKKILESLLDYTDIDVQQLFPGWYAVYKANPAYENVWTSGDLEALEPILNDKFLLAGLRNFPSYDCELEDNITRLRRDLLLVHYKMGALKTKHIPLLCALATHCFQNEYVFDETEEEALAIDNMKLEDPVSVALMGCYRPLKNHSFNEKMSAVAAFRQMLKVLVVDPRREDGIKNNLASAPDITNATSLAVKDMYEENPYPRWSSMAASPNEILDVEADILIAGCGTGLMTSWLASTFPNCKFTAIDISRTSLAYAARKAEDYGLENIRFLNMDILDVERLGEKFDYIESSGVLHHLKDPQEGWRCLSNCLKTGGGMQIALYSAITRKGIDAVRAHIQARGYRPAIDDMRKLRAEIKSLPEGSALRDVLTMPDFYNASMLRDLVFHIQETSYNPEQLHEMIQDLSLSFDGFKIHPSVASAYLEKFSNDPSMLNLLNWKLFEEERPETFIGMYRFFCHKKDEIISDSVQSIRNAQAM